MSRKAKKAMAVALTAGMLASTAATPVMAATQGWKQNAKGWWYQNADGSYPANKWSKINGVWYYFDANGYMLANSWVKDSKGKWYFVGENGAMKINSWAKDSKGLWYWVTDDGSMFEGGWAKIGKDYYFFDADGVMQSGVIKVDGKTYYMGDANQGWMQSGVVAIDGVEYNFAEFPNGACTDEKAPVAAKKFDGKGNLITETVEVEEIDGITAEVVNAESQYKEYGNVVMTGNDAVIKVKVTNNGEPVAGTAVTISTKLLAGEYDIYRPQSYVSMTDSKGYAAFVITDKDMLYGYEQSAVNGITALYSYTATAVTSGETTEGKFAFATISVNDIKVDPDDKDTLVMSTNAATGDSSTVTTTGMDGDTKIKYVKSQQVSLPNSEDHKVTFEINPEIVIPIGVGKNVVEEYKEDINKSLSEYSVYENQEFLIEDVPAGLQYATLNFENIDISEHTKVIIQSYEAGTTTEVGETVVISGPTTQKNLGQQLPIQEDKDIDVKVKIVSEGQVNDGQNGGLVIKDIVGVYKQEGTTEEKKLPLTNPITWEKTQISYSLEKTLEYDDAKYYLPAGSEYVNKNYSYSYQVPVFPYVGNAVVTVKDSNKKVLAYFTVPTVNEYDETSKTNYKNVNVLDESAKGDAILVTKDEAFNSVGTITPNGNRVTVNSSETGVTAFKAKITIGNEEYDLTNNTVNTSVHWSPIPAGVEAEDEFYALTGQKIVVKAQLVDKAGNKVSQSNENITFKYGNSEIKEGATGELVTALSVEGATDSEGRAELVLRATEVQAVLAGLTADTQNSKYDVVLVIGDQTVEKATLRWVTPGLNFTPTVDAPKADVLSTLDETFDGEVSETYVDKYLTKDAGSTWILGYTVNGETQDDINTAGTITTERKVTSIEGLKINISQNGEATLVTDGMMNGAAKLSSTKAVGTKLTGAIDENSLVAGTDVVFEVAVDNDGDGDVDATNKYKNVGEGTPSFAEDISLTLPVAFGTVGTNMEIVSPKGNKVVTGTAQDVYVKLVDSFGNPIEANKKLDKLTVTYTYTYEEDGKQKVGTVTETLQDLTASTTVGGAYSTDSYGKVEVTVKTADLKDVTVSSYIVTKAEVKATYDDVSADCQIAFVDEPADEFLLLNAVCDDSGKQATITFSQNISNFKDGMIVVLDNDTKKPQGITSAKVDGNKVTLTFKNALNTDKDYIVKVVDEIDVDDDSIFDYLCDGYGRSVDDDKINNILNVESSILGATYDGSSKITFTINTEEATTEPILCVWNGGSVLVEDGSLALTEIGDANVTEVTCYYNGASKTVTLRDREAAIEEAKDLLKETNFKITVTDYTEDTTTKADVVEVEGFSTEITVTEGGTADSNIFVNGISLTFASPKSVDTKDTATVKVVYTNDTYSSVTKTVTYKVTLKDSDTTDAEKTADTIVFTQQ
ncbi:MAG: N-acetylmuramoyl-L-alanine amidase family protein [Lachnospiraceae bacterium]|nr:N-acetylmuramoyl-L-alanine amidase family protein [Lachnospiraceae bacterium]